MHPKEALKKFLKSIGADTRSAIVGYIVVVLIVAGGGLSALYKTSGDWVLQKLATPTPLWVAISLALLGYLYIFLKFRQSRTLSPSKTEPIQKTKIKYFTINNLKWKTLIYASGNFKVERIPFCEKHDLSLIPYAARNWVCPEFPKNKCRSKIYEGDLSAALVNAESYIEKEVRNGNY